MLHLALVAPLVACTTGPGPAPVDTDASPSPGAAPEIQRGAFESAVGVRSSHGRATWHAPDGLLLRLDLDLCGDDLGALTETIVDNLDAVHAAGGRAMLALGQGTHLPPSWTDACATWELDDRLFQGPLCHPWDASYQADLRSLLQDRVGPAVVDHPALAGVYFTISSMTNGYELHLRIDRSTLDVDPGDAVVRQAYLDVMDLFQEAFDVPVVFEAGHCLWLERGDSHEECETPLALYRHSRDTWGPSKSGIALWNCAERFWATPTSPGHGVREVIEEATADGVSIGCQTVGPFTEGACRFTDEAVADYGTPVAAGEPCTDSTPADAARACADTLAWFRGAQSLAEDGVHVRGTWGELWSQDWSDQGVVADDAACAAEVEALSR